MLKEEQLHDYQRRAAQLIIDQPYCGLFLECGLGKSVSTLTAIKQLKDWAFIDKVLIIAPKKVAQVTWKDEINNWEHLKSLRISVIDGTAAQRRAAMMADADIYTVSRDNVVWLVVLYINLHGFSSSRYILIYKYK